MGYIKCDCEVYEICPSCAPNEPTTYAKAAAAYNEAARQQVESSAKSYTLAEIEVLAKEWRDENEVTNDAQWVVTHLLAWLARREREVGVERSP